VKAVEELLSPALVAARTPAQMEALAAELERIAALTRRVAEAQRRQAAKPAAKRLNPKRGSGGRPSSPWVRIERTQRATGTADTLFIKISRSLYDSAGCPARLDPQRVGGRLVLVVVAGDAGYKVNVSLSRIAINASGARDLIDLEDGRYAATLEAGAIVVGGRLED
jgi:hypothetical protein